jgi:fructoselysine 6-kinase
VALGRARLGTVGDNCIDRYAPPVRPESVGGNALNVAVGFVQQGHPAAYLGAVGDDAEGRLIIETARAAGVDVEGVRVLGAPTGVTTVELLPDGDRVFLDESYGASAMFRLDEQGLARLRGCAWVHAANLGGARAAVRALVSAGHDVSYDFSDHGDSALRAALCKYLRVAFFSAPIGAESDAVALAEAALAEGVPVAVVTRGGEGSLAASREGLFAQKALEIETVDTLGAGDAFIAAFVVALVAGDGLGESLRRATEWAARTCQIVGPWSTPKEVRV